MDIKLIKTGTFSAERLQALCKVIKGNGKATDLADKIGVNASTLSRILNGKVVSPISDDTIIKLAEQITPEMGITKDMLFRANGCAVEDEMGRVRRSLEYKHTLENELISIVRTALCNSKCSAWHYSSRIRYQFQDSFTIIPDYAVSIEDDGQKYDWAFDAVLRPETQRADDYSSRSARIIQRISMYSMMYFQNQQEFADEDAEYPKRYSVIVHEPDFFEFLKYKFKDLITPMPVSIVLVDIEQRRLVQEFPFRETNGYRADVLLQDFGPYFDDDGNEMKEKDYFDMLEDEAEDFIKRNNDKDM